MRLSTYVFATTVAALLAVPAMTNPVATATPWCGADSLSLSSTAPIYPTQNPYPYIYFSVLLTNTSDQTCTLQGYPGLDLVGAGGQYPGVPPDPANPPFSGIVHASRTGSDGQPVVLVPGATASSRVGFMPKTTDTGLDSAWPPTTIVVTPPDTTTQLQTPWPSGGFTVLLIGDGTKPFVTIDPLQRYA
ncbi:DUF4232 domain-containing protein [Mycolicibacterium sphagni]|uniref:DUF4232 domain-containing protein n=1 Tax=Mycolicibacterium sphagni TaxID=1786 RepID=A0ABX2K0T1_9MYCO|nr:DUF4232 domain-containing protein [Mycolicibacterium sphagni]NTY62674.1 DUF4232 domain-containing protein [Mycolicibacterium sphagni]